ncbi:MAG TPA: 30S ribosomal protein S16 [Polyangiaceae bacterium]|jgi:small subunit ribosomal protein S16
MAVHIRLSRAGAKKHPFYRIIVADQRSPRGGRFLENIGTYDPTREPAQFVIDHARLDYWRSHGALASATVDRLVKRQAQTAAATTPEGAAAKAAS